MVEHRGTGWFRELIGKEVYCPKCNKRMQEGKYIWDDYDMGRMHITCALLHNRCPSIPFKNMLEH